MTSTAQVLRTSGWVSYGLDADDLQWAAGSDRCRLHHLVTLMGLTPNTLYFRTRQ